VVAAEKRVNLVRILVLAVLVAAVGSYIYWKELPQAQKEAEKDKLTGVADDAVTGIELTYPDRTIALSKTDAGWRLTQPIDAPADEPVVKSLLGAITGAQVQKSLDDVPQGDLSPFGLEKPATTITLRTKDGPLPPIHVGKNTAIGAKTYVRKGQEGKIYLTASTIQTSINKQARDLRDKQLLAFQDDDVQRIEIAKPDAPALTLTRKDKDAWTIEPGGVPADATEVRSYLSSLRTTRATDFPDDAPSDLAKYGLEKPRLTVTVATGKDGAVTQQLVVGGESSGEQTKQVYVKRASTPAVFAVGEWAFRSLDKDASALRDKTVLTFDGDAVGRVVLERKEGTGATLVRGASGGWTLDGVDEAKSKATAIQRFVDDLKDLKGSAVAAEPPGDVSRFGLAAPLLRITLTDKSGQPIGTVLGAKQDAKYYVMRDGGPTVFETRDYMYTRLDKQARDFEQSTTPTTAPPAGVAPPAPVPPGEDADDEDAPAGDDDEE
jgi:hypothetical protein